LNKGTHKAVERLEQFNRKVSKNYTGPCYALKCDVKKFFDSVNHQILLDLIRRKVPDSDTLWLIETIINSFNKSFVQLGLFGDFSRERERERETTAFSCGIPIGNLTSQLFANVYLNEFDQFVKHKLRIKFYLRYCDDFVILSDNRDELEKLISLTAEFLENKLKLRLHPNKIIIRKLKEGIDFLGYVVLPHYKVLRTKTKKRMLKKINDINKTSYFGLIKHCNSYGLRIELEARLAQGSPDKNIRGLTGMPNIFI
jgi:hypothetical protein